MPCSPTDDLAFSGMADGHLLGAAMTTDRSRDDIHAAERCCRAQPVRTAPVRLAAKVQALLQEVLLRREPVRARFVPAGPVLRRGAAVRVDAEQARNAPARLPSGGVRRRERRQARVRARRVPHSKGRGPQSVRLRSADAGASAAELSRAALAARSFRSLPASWPLLLCRACVFSSSRPRRIWTGRG